MNRIILFLATLCPLLAWGAPAQPFELREGDRVVFLGDTLMEREKDYGYIELMMTLRFPERNVTFRNLGWSADTPVGISRVSFDWAKGEGEMFRQLMEQVKQVQPTVVVLGYGMASSFDGAAATEVEGRATRVPNQTPAVDQAEKNMGTRETRPSNGVEKFTADYNKLIDGILALNKETRFILLSPIRHEKLPAPLPDPARHNEMLAGYVKAIQGVAEKRGFNFINLFEIGGESKTPPSAGVGERIPNTENGIHLHALGYRTTALMIGLSLGWKMETIPGFASTSQFHPYDVLRQNIIAKNQLFFHRWRPQNSTYLFLFRKHEQGKNAQEIPKFDPLIEAEEKKIATLRKQPPQDPSPGQLARKPSQNPLPDKPATPFKPQPHPTFQLADPNLEVTLWAENPLLAKPIAMNWDARGRLFIASSSLYPQIEPGQAQDDKILILEDTNGDGKADKTTVFADGLLIPTGIEPGDGGCYVGQSTELLHFKDTDGDGIADQRRVVLSGFGTEDTHHILHTLRWGPDGQLYMNQSIYIHTHTETPHGVVRLNSGGTLALRPDTLELGVTMKGLVNGWGHVWDDFGQEFQTDGAGGAGLNWNIPQAMYVTYAGARRIIGSVSPGSYPKFCGLELIKSERFPKEWQGNAVTLDFRANRMVRFEILEQGAGYTTKQHEFLRSTNVTFRPIDVKLGPDGALYIADWSNPIIQHGEVDFRDPRRDREHGRIWRVGYKGGKDVKAPELVKASDKELFQQSMSLNGFAAKQSQRLLTERAASSVIDLLSIEKELRTQAAAMKTVSRASTVERTLLQVIWMYQALDLTEPTANETLERLLQMDEPRVRAAATRVIGTWSGNTPNIPSLAKPRIDSSTALDLLAKRISDDHPRVRIEALRALARIPTARAAELALSVLDKGQVEGFLEYALWLTINDLAEPWAAAVESGAWKIEGREKQLQYALKAIEPKLATKLMTKVIGDKPLPRDGSGGMIELIGQAGGPAQLSQLYQQVLDGGFTEEATARALNWLAEASRLRNAKPAPFDLSTITMLLDGLKPLPAATNDLVRASAAKLAGSWKLPPAGVMLAKLAKNPEMSLIVRQAAIEGMREAGGREAVSMLRQITKDGNDSLRRSAAAALAATDLNGSMPQILEVISATTKEDDALALWRSLIATKGASAALTKALATNSLPEPAAKAGLRAAREGGRNDPNLIMALNKAGSISDPSAALNDNEIHAIAYEVTKGNPVNGEKIYRNKQLGCVLCHSIGGAGGKVGPDMTSLGASTPVVDYIVESVLLPNKRVKEGYNSVQITTKDGEDVAGNLIREDNEQVILRDATAREVSVPKRTIASRKMGGSLMPAGLIDYITPQERLDLYAFLKELGKPGPYDATKQNVARVWRVNSKVGTVNADEMLKTDVRTSKDWTPIYATVSGEIPRTELMEELGGADKTFWAASRFQTSKAGPVRLKISGTTSPKAWVDGKPVSGDNTLTVDLPAGPHTFFLKVTTTDLTARLKLESDDATFLTE
jgi:putative heme-binding domain-containing protein